MTTLILDGLCRVFLWTSGRRIEPRLEMSIKTLEHLLVDTSNLNFDQVIVR